MNISHHLTGPCQTLLHHNVHVRKCTYSNPCHNSRSPDVLSSTYSIYAFITIRPLIIVIYYSTTSMFYDPFPVDQFSLKTLNLKNGNFRKTPLATHRRIQELSCFFVVFHFSLMRRVCDFPERKKTLKFNACLRKISDIISRKLLAICRRSNQCVPTYRQFFSLSFKKLYSQKYIIQSWRSAVMHQIEDLKALESRRK